METCKPFGKLIDAAQFALDRISAWEDSARITHRQTNSQESANQAQNYHAVAERLSAALVSIIDPSAEY